MAKKLILLMGMHKTGTTSIQRACRENKNILATAGYLYSLPEIFVDNQPDPHPENHTKLISLMFIKGNLVPNRNEIIRKITSALEKRKDDLILCAEIISVLNKEDLANLSNHFLNIGYDINPICVIRKLLPWVNSMIAQRVAGKRERIVTFPEAINEFESRCSIVKDRIETIKSVFPETSFVPFDEISRNEYGPAGWFFNKIGVDASISQPKTNERVSDHAVRLASLITKIAPVFQVDRYIYNILIRKIPALSQIPGEKFQLRDSEVVPLLPILIEETNWLKENFGEGFYDEEIKFSDESVTLNDEARQFLIDNLSDKPEPIRSAVKQYLAEHCCWIFFVEASGGPGQELGQLVLSLIG